MNTRARKARVGLIPLVTVLLAGVLLIGYGHLGGSRLVFYAGLIVTAAGVIAGTIMLTGHRTR